MYYSIQKRVSISSALMNGFTSHIVAVCSKKSIAIDLMQDLWDDLLATNKGHLEWDKKTNEIAWTYDNTIIVYFTIVRICKDDFFRGDIATTI